MEGATLKNIYVYDAWGNHRVYKSNGTIDNDPTSIGNLNPFRYRSYYYDSDTGLYYLKSRYYDPEIGQFISPDDMDYLSMEEITGVDLYAYCHNNPVMNYDPDGHLVLSIFIGFVLFRSVGKALEQTSALIGSVFRQFNTKEWNRKEIEGLVSDILFDSLAFTIGMSFGGVHPILGAASYLLTNQLINAIYYNYLSTPDYTINGGSYDGGHYLTRWQRLDYTKTVDGVNIKRYGLLEMHVFGEYTLHMSGFFALPFVENLQYANVAAGPDDHKQPLGFIIDMFSFFFSFSN